MLLQHGANTEGPLLYEAATYGEAPLVELLVHHGAKLDELTGGETPLHSAIGEKHLDVAQLLVSRREWNVRNLSGRTPLHFLANFADDEKLAKSMIKQGAEINPRDKDGATPYGFAIKVGHERVGELLGRNGGTK